MVAKSEGSVIARESFRLLRASGMTRYFLTASSGSSLITWGGDVHELFGRGEGDAGLLAQETGKFVLVKKTHLDEVGPKPAAEDGLTFQGLLEFFRGNLTCPDQQFTEFHSYQKRPPAGVWPGQMPDAVHIK